MKELPELFREQFPYSAPPRILFDGIEVPTALPSDIFITDTTFRDGQQARPPYTVKQIETLFDFLHRLSGPRGVIRQSEFFLYTKKDRDAAYACMEKGYLFPEVTSWIRAVKQDFALVKDMGIKETGILTSISDYHIHLKLGMRREQAMKQYVDIVTAALEAGIRPRCHLEDITRADMKGMVIPFVRKLVELSEESGIPVKVRLCDTMGLGVSYPGAMLPRSVPRIIDCLRTETGITSDLLEWHGHNDFYKVLTNAATAWLYGVGGINGTLLGFGERTGNTPIEALLIEYMGLTGDTSVDTTIITEIAEYFTRELNYQVPPMTPFIGSQFNVTSAGIHADGVVKNEEIYNIFDTGALLNRPLGVHVTDKAGSAGVAFWMNQRLGLGGDERIDKRHEGIQRMTVWVAEQYKDGRTTSLSDVELLVAAKEYLPEFFAGESEAAAGEATSLDTRLP